MDQETKALDKEILEFIFESHEACPSEDTFERLALKLFRYQYERNIHYKKYCDMQGWPPNQVRRWKDVPAMPAVGFKELILTTFPVKKNTKVFRTSGTTRDVKGVHFFDTLKLYEAALLLTFQEFLMPDTHDFHFFFLAASPKEAPASSLSHMMGVIDRTLWDSKKNAFYVRNNQLLSDPLAANLRAVQKRKVIILATAFSLKAFLDHLRHKKMTLALPSGSRLMETGGFKGSIKEVPKLKLYSECEKRLGIQKEFCVSEYGMTELSSQCYDTTLKDRVSGIKRKSFKQGPAWLKTIVIDPETGKEAKNGAVGLLRHFDLANRGSVMAIQTEDLGRAVSGGFEIIGRAPQAELRGCSLSYEQFLQSE